MAFYIAVRIIYKRAKHKRADTLVHPKGTDCNKLTDEILAEIEWKLNHRPRKSLGYRTPLEYCKQLFIFVFEVF